MEAFEAWQIACRPGAPRQSKGVNSKDRHLLDFERALAETTLPDRPDYEAAKLSHQSATANGEPRMNAKARES
jgi:hypothetical protein